MKLITAALTTAIALSSTVAFAQTTPAQKIDREKAAKVRLQTNNGNPNGPTTLSGRAVRNSAALGLEPASATETSRFSRSDREPLAGCI